MAWPSCPDVSIADPTPTAATAHGECDDHDDRGDDCDGDPEDGSTENSLHDQHPSLGCGAQSKRDSTFTYELLALGADEISPTPVAAAPVAAQRPRMGNLRGESAISAAIRSHLSCPSAAHRTCR
jgi:hypothetical protein